GPNDLVIVIRAATPQEAEVGRGRAEELLTRRQERVEAQARVLPRTLETARRRLTGANLAMISVPGAFAAAEALKALRLGLHVMLFSDNVALDDELELKQLAARKGLLVMGPDCGTAYLNGVPLGFANVVPRGRIGIVAASGTGLQQVAVLLAARGEGLSHGIGVGGRDMGESVGGLMTLQALDALGSDPRTEGIVVIGKPPAASVPARGTAKRHEIGKPAVVALLGREVTPSTDGRIVTVTTLEDAAHAAWKALHGERAALETTLDAREVQRRVSEARRVLLPAQRAIRGLYAGGTLAHEAILIVERLLGPVASNLGSGAEGLHQ